MTSGDSEFGPVNLNGLEPDKINRGIDKIAADHAWTKAALAESVELIKRLTFPNGPSPRTVFLASEFIDKVKAKKD